MSKRKFDFVPGDIVGSRRISSEGFIAENRLTSYEWVCTVCESTGVMTQIHLKNSVACCNDWIERGRDRLRVVWTNMHERCTNPRHPAYLRYGGAGIEISGWDDYPSFRDWALAQGYRYVDKPDLDRIDNAKGYSPDNCRFVSRRENSRNRRDNRYITANGETLLLVEWAERLGTRVATISRRLRDGWSEKRAVTTQVRR